MEKRPFLDFKDIKARASFLGVLDRYHVQVRKVNQSQFKADCPLPSHENTKEHGTFGVNVEKGVFKCFSDSCRKAGNGSQGNVIDFVRAMDNCTPYDAAAKLNDWFPGSAAPANGSGNGHASSPFAAVPAAEPEANRPLAFTLKDVNPEHPMIQERGISVETARKFGVGYFPGKGSMAARVVFPLVEDSNLVGYAGRTTLEVTPENPKWKLPAGLHKTFLYGLERATPDKPLVLVESFWGVLFFHENHTQAVALMGKELTPEQEKRLAPFSTIIVAMDNDEPGRAATERIAGKLKPNHKVLKAHLVE
jgi:DNA primase